jgi:hypothetical protein
MSRNKELSTDTVPYWPQFFSPPAAAEASRIDREAAAMAELEPELEAQI